ncbi:VWA domain-containing protein [Bacillus sp. S/N-304-OC-R1]|uniref:VWA domain-containing protein n=1 Tax=Bacillus sp. S/N-304-OC-R1 TaxID=2758034 RepID=UPI0028BF3E3C|nr:VWA domain-containing protein [Bacillus sp. S/N-304-OC-R1]
MRRFALLLLILIPFVLSACSNDKEIETSTPIITKEDHQQEQEQAQKQDEILAHLKNFNLEVSEESLLFLPPGKLMSDLSYEKDVEDIGFDTPTMERALQNKLTPELEKLTKETTNTEEIKKGLLSLLASPHYKEVIEKAKAYEPEFEEPYLPDPTLAEGTEEKNSTEKTIILLDASSSMLLTTEGKVKMDIAKEAVKSFAQTIGQTSEVSLVVYGHKGSESAADKEISCKGIEEIYPMGKYSKEQFHGAVDSFESKGWTPLAGAIEKAAEMSSSYDGVTTIYIVSDGAETCDGDPVQASKDLVQQNSGNKVNIIGFDVDSKTENQLKAVAEAGNGEYFRADNPEELKNTIQYKWLPSTLDLAFAFTMSPDGWEMVAEYKKGEEYPLLLRNIGRSESHRILDAIKIMAENEWITPDQESELRNWAHERNEELRDLYYAIYKTNREKADAKSQEIKQRVDEWVEKMKELKKERGDTW